MENKEWIILQVLINHYCAQDKQALLKFLSPEVRQKMMMHPLEAFNLSSLLYPQKALENMHYSWIAPSLKTLPGPLQSAFASALTNEQMTGLKVTTPLELAPPIKDFILHKLCEELKVSNHLPIDYLPQTKFSSLLQWKKSELVNLMDFLGLYDLAAEMRHIVDRNYLKNIYACLTSKQFHYLKICMHQKERIVSPKLGIDLSKQDCPQLKRVIHRRGLIRLGRALWGLHPDFIWHLAHALDNGRGSLLLKEYQTKPIANITPILQQQVLNVMNFVKNE